MSANQEELLRSFRDVTGADDERSRFFLDSSNWQLEVAISSFFEHGGNMEQTGGRAPDMEILSDSDDEASLVPPARPPREVIKTKREPSSKFATLDSLKKDSSDSEEEGQAFYAGGSERSGQQIIGPGKDKKDVVAEMFKTVRERGALVMEDEPQRRGNTTFGGTGYRLGATADDHTPVPSQDGPREGGSRSVRLSLYREGFTVDNGPLRPYCDPENAAFLNCVRRGEVPDELASAGAEVRVSLEDKRHEECSHGAGSAKAQAFAGKGQVLGSPTPPTVGATAPVAADVSDREANERAARAAIALDESQPVTSIQFRLADGSRLVGRFNLRHTVADLIQYVTTAVPMYQLQSFVLMTTFPSNELSDSSLTIDQAKLQNSVLVQRIK